MPGDVDIDLNRRRSLGDILGATAQLYRRFPLLFVILALAVMGPFELLVLAATGYAPLRHGRQNFGISVLLDLLDSSLLTPLISALHMHAVLAISEGRRPRIAAVAMRGLVALPVVGAAQVMAGLGILLGFLALLVPGIVLWIRWAVVAQAATLEGKGWQEALRGSARLTDSNYAHVFSLLVLTVALGFGLVRAAWAIPLGSATSVASVSVGIALKTVIASFSALTLALLYFDLRVRAVEAQRQAPREYRHARDLD